MTPEEVDLARTGDLDALGAQREKVAEAVRAYVEAGDSAAALELVARAWHAWFSPG